MTDAGPLAQFTIPELQLLAMGLWWLVEEERVNPGAVPEWRELIARMRSVLRAAIEERTG